ncbi:AAA family ATPase [Chelativorans salis]|uniref:AAA family ATPase n=1 Tax=Chelativorans salis TaxID=2978478 RepID=A0ABT2LTL5_9HYPH|nr:AAA family ATPase [Chelativorans sp. EGI FJ00035]MCT7377882.1 AAA family ATPase [Chelativorans sp. EGI FJ00035]
MSYYLRVLGGFELLHDDTPIPIVSAKQRCLFASLALALPHSCHREVLAERLWGERGDEGASQNLRTALSQLRKQFVAEPLIGAQREEVWLRPESIQVDALNFKTLLANGDLQSLRAASDLYNGDFLRDVRIRDADAEQWISDQRGWHRARALEVFVKLSENALGSGDFESAVQDGRRAVLLDDLAEEAHRALLNALLAANRRGEAMRHARSMLELFETALGVTPSSETMAVIERVQTDSGTRAILDEASSSPAVRPLPDSAAPATVEAKRDLIEQRVIVALSYEINGVAEVAEHENADSLANLVGELDRLINVIAEEWLGVAGANALDHGVIFFGIDGQAEDYASDAVTAANELSEAIDNYRWQSRPDQRFCLKAGLADGLSLIFSPHPHEGKPRVLGHPELVARRMRLLAPTPGIYVSNRLRARVSRYFKFQHPSEPSDSGKQVDAFWRLVTPRRVSDRFEARRQRVLPIVGRRSELELLISRWSDACGGLGQFVIVRGDPGIGKSRLLYDLRGRLKAAGVRPWLLQCAPGGSRTAFSPVANMFASRRRWTQQPDAVFARAARRLGVSDSGHVEQLGFASGIIPAARQDLSLSTKEALRRNRSAIQSVIGARARKGAVCIVVEDIHWADPTTLTELEALSSWIADKPVLIVLTTRDDSLRSISDASNALDLKLRRLDAGEMKALATSLWEMVAEDSPTSEQLAFVSEFSDGIPLFLEELVLWRLRMERSVGTSPALRTDSWGDPTMPLNDLLLSRLNTLGEGRRVAQIAAVLGRSFDVSTLREVMGDLLPEENLTALLAFLVDQNVLRQIWPQPDAEYEFRHALLREAAYSSLRDADRRVFHQRVFKHLEQQFHDGLIIRDVDLAWHAERAGNYRVAATILARAGRDSAARWATAEARSCLSHALELTSSIDDIDAREGLQLEIIAALGPLVTSQFGPRDDRAQELYNRGVDIARQRPSSELADWFPVFWGWWYTGADFRIMHDRALRVQEMLSGVDDPEVKLQINHSIWAIDFNLGRHREALAAIETGLRLYDAERARMNRALFGGHDAKVCGLLQRALCLWLTGNHEASDAALAEMIGFTDSISHIPSKAHSLDGEAVSAFYRNDFTRLSDVCGRMGELAAKHEMEFLTGLSLLFGGWAEAYTRDLESGHNTFFKGLAILRHLGSAVDLPIYLDMYATLLGRKGQTELAIATVTDAITEARQTGHAYWLAELFRRRAALRAQAQGDPNLIVADLRSALTIADGQGAIALKNRSEQTAEELKLASQLLTATDED